MIQEDLLLQFYPALSPIQIDDILETLRTWDCLNENGKKLQNDFWEKWIKE